MNTADAILNITNISQEDESELTWARVTAGRSTKNKYKNGKNKSKKKNWTAQGEPPLLNDEEVSLTNLNSKANNYTMATETFDEQADYPSIVSSVREATGGYNTMSNQAAEKYYKKRQEINDKESHDSSWSTVVTTSSSKTGSFKTALNSTYQGSNFNTGSISSSSVFYDASQSPMKFDAYRPVEEMRNHRLDMFFQSEEDPDVYVHGLKEKLPKDEEWLKYRLQRKGIEVHLTPRQYFFGLDDDKDFTFEKRSKK